MSTLTAVDIATLLERDPPTPDQVHVVEAPLEPLLVVAGAGSGKTETMAARVVWLIANGHVAPHEVLGLTFTRKAAAELGDRVRLRLRRLLRAMPAAGIALPPAFAATAGAGDELTDGRRTTGAGTVTGSGLDLARPTVSTYNSYAAAIVSDHALRLGIEPTSRLLGEAGQWQLAHEVVESWAGDLDTEAATSTLVDAVLSLSGALAEHLRSPAEARAVIEDLAAAVLEVPDAPRKKGPYAEVATLVRSLGERARLLDVVEAYQRRKRAADAIDFGDQVAIAARLAREVAAVGETERSRFRVVLLDEYQDTSHAQLELLSGLFGGGHPVTAVGDPHQSIYGWRGASAGGLERFPERFPRVVGGQVSPAPVRYLATSWRNDHAVLGAANHVAGPLRAPRQRPGPDHTPLGPDGPRLVDVPRLRAAPRAGAGTVRSVYAATVEEEAAAVAEFVAERWRPTGRGPGGGRVTAAVLCRKRSQFDSLEVALRAAGLPVEVVGLGGLLHTPEVVDLVSVLRAAHDPSRGDALMRLLTGARVRLGAADLHALAQWAGELAQRHGPVARSGAREATGGRVEDPSAGTAADGDGDVVVAGDAVDERSIVDALDDLPPHGWSSRTGRSLTDAARPRLERLGTLLRTLRSHTYLSLPELVGEAERLLDLDIEVAARPGLSPGRARAHLDAFRDVAVQFSEGADAPTLGAFLAWIDAAAREERGLDRPVTEPDPDAVQLITIHAAKGLEWDVVAVAGMTDGVLPATPTSGPQGPAASGWLTGLGVLPYPLRGDADELPVFAIEDAVDHKELEFRRKQFRRDVGAHEVAEERRLAYVALTRARSALLLSGAWWRDRKDPSPPSTFLQELARAGLVQTDGWAAEPAPDAVNPRTVEPVTHAWPTDPFGPGPRRAQVTAAAAAVRSALGDAGARRTPSVDGRVPGASAVATRLAGPHGPTAAVAPSVSSLERRAEILLAERDRAREPRADVSLPAHLSASALVRLAEDRAAFAEALRRPVPLEPSVQARRGTEFHAWVERYFGAASLVDVDALPGADDDSVPVDVDGSELRTRFLATPWAAMRPRAVEVDIETPVAGYVLRCRIDAVFDGPDGTVTVVDWKTGRPPVDEGPARAREVQLAVYRLAWSRWSGTPVDQVDAAFCYVGTGQTVRPERLLGESEIEALLAEAAAG